MGGPTTMQRSIVLTVVIAAAVFAHDVDETIPELYVDETSAEVLPKPATTMTATSSSSSCPALTASGPVTVENDGQIIENLDITAGDSTFNSASTATNKWTAVPGITCYGKKDVVIRNVRVTHYPQGKDAIAGSSAATYWAAVLAEHPDEDKTVTTTTTTTTGTSIDEEEYEYDFVATNSKVFAHTSHIPSQPLTPLTPHHIPSQPLTPLTPYHIPSEPSHLSHLSHPS